METRGDVLHPLSISLAGSTPDDQGLHMEVYLTDVRLSVSPAMIALLNTVYLTMVKGDSSMDDKSQEEIDHSELWAPRQYDDENFWFLRPELAEDASITLINYESGITVLEPVQNKEICLVNIPMIVVTIEAGVGNKTLPMLILESGFQGKIANWSSQVSMEATLKLQMGYYNSHLALWEPLIEPVELIKDNTSVYVPWELKFEMSVVEKDNDLSAVSPVDEQVESPASNTSVSMDISSKTMLEITITKTCLEVLNNLGKAFASAIEEKQILKTNVVSAPYLVVNQSGIKVTLLLNESSFSLYGVNDPQVVILEDQTEVPLQLKSTIVVEKIHLGQPKEVKVGDRLIRVKVCSFC